MVPRTPLSKVPRVLTKRQILGTPPKPSKSESLGDGSWGTGNQSIFNKISFALPQAIAVFSEESVQLHCFILFFIVEIIARK